MRRLGKWLMAVAMAGNQLVNALTGGDPDMAVSARAAYARDKDKKMGKAVCRVLEFLDPHWLSDHCQIALENHERRTRAAAEKTKR